MTNYLAITTGPIFDTLQQARKTRELWAASFLFSRLMELFLENLHEIGAEAISPQKKRDDIPNNYGVGIYNDRLFATIGPWDHEKINGFIDNTVEKLAKELAPEGIQPDKEFWQQYLRIKWVVKPLKDLENDRLFKEVSSLLDSAELHSPYFQDEPAHDRLLELLVDVYETSMAKNALKTSKGSYEGLMSGLFPSTSDFATFELFQKKQKEYKKLQKDAEKAKKEEEEEEEQVDLFYSLLFEDPSFKKIATDYHKYFCIVHADGDNLSKLNSTFTKEKEYKDLSIKLSGFALESARKIDKFGGKSVYIGGDDLLFFAPVCAQRDGKTISIFNLINELDADYHNLNLGNTSLSFGITLTYHKFPLFEARELSYELLNYTAKKVIWKDASEKNAIAFRLLRHSGAWFGGVFSKDVLAEFIKTEEAIRATDKDLLSGIVFKMDTLSDLLLQLENVNNFEDRVTALFTNMFNEPVHRHNQDQMDMVRKLLVEVFKSPFTLENEEEKPDRIKNLYAILRILKFVTDRPKKTQADTAAETQSITSTH